MDASTLGTRVESTVRAAHRPYRPELRQRMTKSVLVLRAYSRTHSGRTSKPDARICPIRDHLAAGHAFAASGAYVSLVSILAQPCEQEGRQVISRKARQALVRSVLVATMGAVLLLASSSACAELSRESGARDAESAWLACRVVGVV